MTGQGIDPKAMQRAARILVISSRAARGERPDQSAPLLAAWLHEQRFWVREARIVADGDPVREALVDLLAESPALILTTGGTGLTPDDLTPEQTRTVLDREIPGIPEAIRAAGRKHTPMADLSRGCAGIAGSTLIVNLPGSAGGIKDALKILEPMLDHALAQIGGSHEH
ncbi:MogA/MoaB family molybdenum cofactor biosynthesis protein [Acaricomes phytoseiuli]|uniref:MogA/MoaB family molybdenum cofactor biosynthesis protein n=1 Tax=Acaricomes phytoseiuli TaxID=291968 RepID=UPI00035DAF06|nr:MogA/MoaB family molybdenum cofactor biosynthesis protein [Acaricomes phytoseiuli]MCW1248797.1 MogA/MoaB family molybdenum cofactor biosynthesis protein [Acaricomes phytoseiuli]